MIEKTISDIDIPYGLTERQVKIAQDYVISRIQDGFTVESFCSKHSLSTKSFYQWKADASFNQYMEALNEVLIPKDVLNAVDKFRLKVMQFVEKDTMPKDEMAQFYNMFKPIIDASNRMEAEKLGLNVNAGSTASSTSKTVEERKAILLGRLTGKTEGGK